MSENLNSSQLINYEITYSSSPVRNILKSRNSLNPSPNNIARQGSLVTFRDKNEELEIENYTKVQEELELSEN